MLSEGLLDKSNTAGAVWADTAYRSKANERFMAENGFRLTRPSQKAAGRPMPVRTARANGAKSKVRAKIEHIFAEQKSRMGPVHPHGRARPARTKIGLANLVYNVKRLIVLERWAALGA
jgi:hypothetical protein